MPRESHRGELPPASSEVRAIAETMKSHVHALAVVIGERRVGHRDSLNRARHYLQDELKRATGQPVRLETIGETGERAVNLVLELPGSAPELVVVGAHYDSAPGTRGANDNASGVAAVLVLARRLAAGPRRRSLRFVLFANEEPPYFQNPGMGSLVHAENSKRCQDPIVAMLSLESLGYYSTETGSQRYPGPIGWLYPNRGDFVGFVGNPSSRSLVRRAIATFRATTPFPSEGAALPGWIPGVGWSDHWSFWQFGYPAIMLTDTAVFRDPSYHSASDDIEHLDFLRLARVTLGIEAVIAELLKEDGRPG